MPPQHFNWALLPGDIWRAVLLRARGNLQPLNTVPTSKPDELQPWWAWWRLVACMACTCRALREALSGSASAELWRWAHLQSEDWQHHRLELSLVHAPYAHSAVMLGASWTEHPAFTAAARLSSLRELHVIKCNSGSAAACVFAGFDATLAPQLSRLNFQGVLPMNRFVRLSGLQHVRMDLVYLSERQLRCVAAALPQLQTCEMRLVTGHSSVCELSLLVLLPVHELTVCLFCYSGVLTQRLRQLAGTPLQALCLQTVEKIALTTKQEQLLTECQVKERVVVSCACCADDAKQLRSLPSGAAVVYEPTGWHQVQRVDCESDN